MYVIPPARFCILPLVKPADVHVQMSIGEHDNHGTVNRQQGHYDDPTPPTNSNNTNHHGTHDANGYNNGSQADEDLYPTDNDMNYNYNYEELMNSFHSDTLDEWRTTFARRPASVEGDEDMQTHHGPHTVRSLFHPVAHEHLGNGYNAIIVVGPPHSLCNCPCHDIPSPIHSPSHWLTEPTPSPPPYEGMASASSSMVVENPSSAERSLEASSILQRSWSIGDELEPVERRNFIGGPLLVNGHHILLG